MSLREDLAGFGSRLQKSFLGRCAGSFLYVQGIDRAMVLASQAFTALIPLLILVSALAPANNKDLVSSAIIRRFDLAGGASGAVNELFQQSGEGSTSALGAMLLLFSGVSLTRRLQRMYVETWRLELVRGVRGSLNAALGLVVLLVELTILYVARSLVRGLPLDGFLGVAVSVLSGVVLWTSVPWLILDCRLPWKRLVPGGVLTAVGTALYGFATTIYMPRLLETYSIRYGLFGVTLALVGWLLAISFIVVASAVVSSEFDRAPEPWARALRVRLGLEPAPGDGSVRGG